MLAHNQANLYKALVHFLKHYSSPEDGQLFPQHLAYGFCYAFAIIQGWYLLAGKQKEFIRLMQLVMRSYEYGEEYFHAIEDVEKQRLQKQVQSLASALIFLQDNAHRAFSGEQSARLQEKLDMLFSEPKLFLNATSGVVLPFDEQLKPYLKRLLTLCPLIHITNGYHAFTIAHEGQKYIIMDANAYLETVYHKDMVNGGEIFSSPVDAWQSFDTLDEACEALKGTYGGAQALWTAELLLLDTKPAPVDVLTPLSECGGESAPHDLGFAAMGALHLAARLGNARQVEFYLKHGHPVNARTGYREIEHPFMLGDSLYVPEDSTPLHLACRNGHEETVQVLLDGGADPFALNRLKEIPLHSACVSGSVGIVAALLDLQGSSAMQVSCDSLTFYLEPRELTPLEIAVKHGHEELVTFLLARHRATNRPFDYRRIMHIALKEGHVHLAKMLWDESKQLMLMPVIMEVLGDGDEQAALFLLERIPAEITPESYPDLLVVCARTSSPGLVRLLIERGFLLPDKGRDALEQAIEGGNHAVLKILLEQGAQDSPDLYGNTLLRKAALKEDIQAVKWLLSQSKKHLNTPDAKQITLLEHLVGIEDKSFILYLMEIGAKVTDGPGHTHPLHIACRAKEYEFVRMLLERGGVIAPDHEGITPLHILCRQANADNFDIIAAMVDLAPEYVHAPSGKSTRTPFLSYLRKLAVFEFPLPDPLLEKLLSVPGDIPCKNGDFNPLDCLVQMGSSVPALECVLKDPRLQNLVNLRNKTGLSPLHLAVCERNIGATRVLLEAGANPELPDIDGESAITMARDDRQEDILALLESYQKPKKKK